MPASAITAVFFTDLDAAIENGLLAADLSAVPGPGHVLLIPDAASEYLKGRIDSAAHSLIREIAYAAEELDRG
ncbi:hypothetical protein OG612_18645 [Streptomyces sp. NBC_01527]|uniref:hypothetical protein n=1 Tax=Streptomyces sp. NBC_01527 TaxID=2903894 RepID=UPI003869A91B